MRFAFIAKHRSVWPVAWLCEALDVSRSGFHAWLHRGAERPVGRRRGADGEDPRELRGQRPNLRRTARLARRAGRRRRLRPAQDRAADAGERLAGAAAPPRPAEG